MSTYEMLVQDGPGKAELLRAADEHAPSIFETDEGRLEVRVDAVNELGHGIADVAIQGDIVTGAHAGLGFIGTYDPNSHKGCLHLQSPDDCAVRG
jgi:hypothetical protein